jgi:hypothetical protein
MIEADIPNADSPKRKRRWFQFSLRLLMVRITIVAPVVFSCALDPHCAAADQPDVAKLLKNFSVERLDDGRAATLIEKLLDSKPTDDEIPELADVANSEKSSLVQRVFAIGALVDRQSHAAMTAGELGKILHGATWLGRVSIVDDLAGYIPVKFVEGDTVFVLTIPEPGTRKKSSAGVWLRFQGEHLSADALLDSLHDKKSPLDASKLTASAVSPTIRELIKRIKARQGK